MKLKDQITSLELSKQIKELGFPQDNSLWYWVRFKGGKDYSLILKINEQLWVSPYVNIQYNQPNLFEEIYSAPTVAEWGEKLPYKYNDYWFSIRNGTGWCCVNHLGAYYHPWEDTSQSKTEANARAKMWIYWKKNERK